MKYILTGKIIFEACSLEDAYENLGTHFLAKAAELRAPEVGLKSDLQVYVADLFMRRE